MKLNYYIIKNNNFMYNLDTREYNLLVILIFIIGIYLIIIFLKSNINEIEGWTNTITKKIYGISIMCIFKNEQDYMEEWIQYHKSQGIDHIFMYCNDPNLKNYPYLNNQYKNFITIIDWVNKTNQGSMTIQRQAYTHCVNNYSNQTQFLLMLDLDEFLVTTKGYLKVSDYIGSIKSNWDKIKAFKIPRYDFGSNGHITKSTSLVMSNYKLHEKLCSSYKTMANTDFVNKNEKFFGVHDFNFIDKSGKIFNNNFGYHETGFPNSCKTNFINDIPLVINHYYTKSYQEYLSRCQLWIDGGINPIGHRTDCENKFKSRDINEVEGY
jgi:hypothetical protein